MKIVINKCYGGFGLSKKAIDLCYQKGSKIIETSIPEKYYGKKDWRGEFEKDENWLPLLLRDNLIISFKRDEDRDDSILVSVVEELRDEANGDHAELEVVEIPDDVKWEIEEYDGIEWISEEHRKWS